MQRFRRTFLYASETQDAFGSVCARALIVDHVHIHGTGLFALIAMDAGFFIVLDSHK